MAGRSVTVLGPQRRPTVHHVLRALSLDGPAAIVTAGWQEREADDEELRQLVGGEQADSVVNLRLRARWLEVLEQEPELAAAERAHDAALAELRHLYLVQLDHALAAVYDVAHRSHARPRLRERALGDAIEAVQLLDTHHLARVAELQTAFWDAWRPQEHPRIAAHREQVHAALRSVVVAVLAGGHIGDLLRVLHLFHVEPHLPQSVVAWSAGAMALTERVVLFHDFVPHGMAATEVHGEGLGTLRGAVLLPHPRRRLRVDDRVRMAVLARRFAPAHCVVLDDGVRVSIGEDACLPSDARVVGIDGAITSAGAA
jgi:hypothetical protein